MSESITLRRSQRTGKRARAAWSFDPETAAVRNQIKEPARASETARRLCEVSSALERVPWIPQGVIGDIRQVAKVAGVDALELRAVING